MRATTYLGSDDANTHHRDDRAARAHFATDGDPAWPSFNATSRDVLSLAPPQPHIDPNFAATHHGAFWAAG